MGKLIRCALVGASAMGLAQPAWGQDAAAPSGTAARQVDDAIVGSQIIVTARRRSEDIQSIPLVVNAVSATEISKLNLRNFQELETLVPGLDLRENDNGIGGNASIRGVNFDINTSGNNPTVEFYLNDTPITSGAVLQQMYDVGQIEVLRGPQGTLRGRASPSGSITVTVHKPDLYDAGGYATMTGNAIGGMNINGASGIPIVEGVLAVRAGGLWSADEGNRVRTIERNFDARDPYNRSYSGRVAALFQPLEWLQFEGMYQRINRYSRFFAQVESADMADPTLSPSGPEITAKDRLAILETPATIRQRFDIYTWRAEAALAGQRLIYVGGYRKQKLFHEVSGDEANYFPDFEFGTITRTKASDQSHEIRLQNEERVAGIFDYVVGGFIATAKSPTMLDSETPLTLPAFLGGSVVSVVDTSIYRYGNTKEKSAFGNITAHIGSKTEISGGLRYIDIKGLSQLSINDALILDRDDHNGKLIYSASINHFLTPDIMIYANTGTSFRPGPTAIGDFSIVKSPLQLAFTTLDPESSTSYEVGTKTTWLDGRLRFNLTGYYQKFKNYPYRSPGVFYQSYAATRGAGGTITVTPEVDQFAFIAAVPVEVRGVEAELGFEFNDRWSFSAVASYADGKIKNGLVPCNDLDGDGKPDQLTSAPTLAQVQAAYGSDNLAACTVTQRSSFQAPFSASVQSEYSAPISPHVDAFARGLFSFSGKSQGDPDNPFDNVGAYGLLNLFLGVRGQDNVWEAQFYVKNVMDTAKVLTRASTPVRTNYQILQPPTFNTTAAGVYEGGYRSISMTAPREFGLTVRYAFGSR